MKLFWLSRTRPNLLLEVSQSTQVTKEMFKKEAYLCLKRLNSAIKYAVENLTSIIFSALRPSIAQIVGISGAYFAKNVYNTTQLG